MKGIYVLIIQLGRDTDVTVGKLGTLHFTKGLYAYVGSAQKGIEKRIERHLRREKRMFWHIDYLLQSPTVRILSIFYELAGKTEECVFANRLREESEPIAGFGCSDCNCTSHLFRINDCGFLRESMQEHVLISASS